MPLAYRVLNVFTVGDDPFSGNPLAVFEDAGALDGDTMQRLARQLNLSETTFVTSLDREAREARVRIFTVDYEMPFAGHPTLGTAHVVADLLAAGGPPVDDVALLLPAGRVPVSRTTTRPIDPAGPRWTLTTAQAPGVRPPDASRTELAAMLGLDEADLGDDALFVDTGVEQLVVPLASLDAVHRLAPVSSLLAQHARSEAGMAQALVWAASGLDTVEARFVVCEGGGLMEDPATGSACANLGGWFVARGAHEDGGLSRTVSQGSAVHRPSRLHLEVGEDATIRVAGSVLEVGRGTFPRLGS